MSRRPRRRGLLPPTRRWAARTAERVASGGSRMAKAAPEDLITALDIGSSKVSAMIAQKADGGELIVLGTGQRERRGVKRGYTADMTETEIAVRAAGSDARRGGKGGCRTGWSGW